MTDANKKEFRRDIEGLRAVAVLLVLIFHAGLPLTGGYVGVDVFFVISGFLITSLLVREAESEGRISLLSFYARRAKRLLPAASAVLLVSLGLIWRFAPETARADFAVDVALAAGYFANWRFAHRSVDYLAEDLGRSPILHFWSLSVEEQFYFVWPLLIISGLWFARRTGKSLRPIVGFSLALVTLPSLGWAVYFTEQSSAEAFFVTTTRLWELGVGGALALALPWVASLSTTSAQLQSFCGLGLLVFSAFYFDGESRWPGALALAPTLGTALLISGGAAAKGSLITRVLSSSPMVWIGGLSYSLYLWHWPILVVGQDWLSLKGPVWGAGLVLASVIPAWLSYRFIEAPVRFAKSLQMPAMPTVSAGLNLSLMAAVVGLAFATFTRSEARSSQSTGVELLVKKGEVLASPAYSGAGALGRDPVHSKAGEPRDKYAEMRPPPTGARRDLPSGLLLGCQALYTDAVSKFCVIGDRKGKKKIFVLGDSKITQYYEPLDAAGRALGYKIVIATKARCPFSSAGLTLHGQDYKECVEFNEMVMLEMEKSPPFAVITSQFDASGHLPEEPQVTSPAAMETGLVKVWSRIRKWGTEVVVLLDNPDTPQPIYDCILKNPDKIKKCSFDKKRAIAASAAPTQRRAAARVPGVKVIDLVDYICPQKKCAPVIGDVLIYRHGSHLTNTYARTLAPVLTKELSRALSSPAQ